VSKYDKKHLLVNQLLEGITAMVCSKSPSWMSMRGLDDAKNLGGTACALKIIQSAVLLKNKE
jgi:hypothetical protein